MKRDPVVLIVVAMVIALMLVFGFNMARKPAPTEASSNALAGKSAPDFTLQSLDGKTVHLSDYRGKAVVLNFWATWCAPCKIEMPWFVDLQKKYAPEGLQLVGVASSMATPTNCNPSAPYFFCSSTNHGISILQGAHQVAQKFSTTAFPW